MDIDRERRDEQGLLLQLYPSRFGEDTVDGSRLHGVVVSFAKDSSVGFGALKKRFKSLSVTRSAIALSLEQLTASRLSKATPK
ncbi:MAG TPA: hypothetical protein VFS67_21810 [Polyangiaceae bacterium]|nr:hypothetical protein [Polyangiaceae bacterium]